MAGNLEDQFAKLAAKMVPGEKLHGSAPESNHSSPYFDYESDEERKTVAVTDQGLAKAETFLGIDDLSEAAHGNLVNHLVQALKAESLYKRGLHYEVIDGEVTVIDVLTGRMLKGRQWSQGLRQAIEAKERVALHR